ncbi:MAG: EamA family transporter [Aestuariivirga sp.]
MKPLHILLAVVIAAVWGFNFVIIKVGVAEVPPFLLTGLRFLICAVPMVFFMARPKVSWVYVVGFGLMLSIGQFVFLFLAVYLGMSASLASLLLQSQVFFTMFFAVFALKELPRVLQIVGAALAFGGIGLIAVERWSGPDAWPLVLCLIAAAGWGASNIIAKWAEPENAVSFVAWSSLAAPIPLFVMSWIFESHDKIVNVFFHPTLIGTIAIFYLAYLSTLFGYSAWNYLLKRYPAGTVAPFTLLVPLFGIGSGIMVLGESFDRFEIGGGLLVIAGLVVANFDPRIFAQKRAEL